MLKRKLNTILYDTGAGGGEKTCVLDCSPVTNARNAYNAAVAARQNAETLRDSLKTEKDNVSSLFSSYTGTYNTFMQCGDTVANPQNMGSNGLSDVINCLGSYGQAVSDAYQQSLKDVQDCIKAEKDALNAYKSARCVCR